MNQAKGLSQILYLIIAASVLMIAALSMVFMLDEGLSGIIDFGGEADNTACERALQTVCTGRSGETTVGVPSSCVDSEGNIIPPADEATTPYISDGADGPNQDVECAGDV